MMADGTIYESGSGGMNPRLNHTGGWNQISIKVDGGQNHQTSKVVDGTTELKV